MEISTINGIDLGSTFDEPIDKMKLFFNWEYPITDKVTVYQPTIQDIIDYPGGEEAFMFLVHIFTGNTTFFRVTLWEQGIDWNDITDWELFVSLVKSLDNGTTKIFLGDTLDFTKMIVYPIEDDVSETAEESSEDNSEEQSEDIKKDTEVNKRQKFVLYDIENDIEFNELTFLRVRNYVRYTFNIFPKIEHITKSRRVKEEAIFYDKQLLKNQKDKSDSFLFPLISTCLVYPGFKYKKEELRQVGIVEFMDAVQRIQIIENSKAVMNGLYSGFVDGSKIPVESYNFMKDLSNEKKNLTTKEIAMNSITSEGKTKE